jgi:hypothetical protein
MDPIATSNWPSGELFSTCLSCAFVFSHFLVTSAVGLYRLWGADASVGMKVQR